MNFFSEDVVKNARPHLHTTKKCEQVFDAGLDGPTPTKKAGG
jgi:hypothetical protein